MLAGSRVSDTAARSRCSRSSRACAVPARAWSAENGDGQRLVRVERFLQSRRRQLDGDVTRPRGIRVLQERRQQQPAVSPTVQDVPILNQRSDIPAKLRRAFVRVCGRVRDEQWPIQFDLVHRTVYNRQGTEQLCSNQ